MTMVNLLSLMLAASSAVNIAFCAGIAAHRTGMGLAQAFLVSGGAAGTELSIYIAAVAAYR